jgi:hypothetical protein
MTKVLNIYLEQALPLKVIFEEIIFEEEFEMIKNNTAILRSLSEDFQELSLKLIDLEELRRDFKDIERTCKWVLSCIMHITCEFDVYAPKINKKLNGKFQQGEIKNGNE